SPITRSRSASGCATCSRATPTRSRRRSASEMALLAGALGVALAAVLVAWLVWQQRLARRIADAEDAAVSARRQARDDAAARRRLEEAVAQFPQGVVVCDAAGEVVACNDEAAPFLAARHGDVLAERVVTEL